VASHKIHIFDFINLSQPPELVMEQLATHTRPGANGVTIHRLGIWAQPFQITSRAGAASLAEAYNFYNAYLALVGAAPVGITWARLPFDLTFHRFYVTSVKLQRCDTILFGFGPDGAYFAEVDCVWTLQPIRHV
jgi:hypothetical protein